jgi:hypothetical protein
MDFKAPYRIGLLDKRSSSRSTCKKMSLLAQ